MLERVGSARIDRQYLSAGALPNDGEDGNDDVVVCREKEKELNAGWRFELDSHLLRGDCVQVVADGAQCVGSWQDDCDGNDPG